MNETPLELFSGTTVTPKYNVHTFGCPAYALDERIQGGMKGEKWGLGARIAIYVGPSIMHARSIGNLLSLTTGLVSPQFHVRYDDTFSTLRNSNIVRSQWQTLAGFQAHEFGRKVGNFTPYIPTSQHTNISVPTDNSNENPILAIDHNDQVPLAYENEGDMSDGGESFESSDDENTMNQLNENDQQHHLRMTRSGRISRFPRRYDDYVALLMEHKSIDEVERSMALAASADPDILYLHEALKAEDNIEFRPCKKRYKRMWRAKIG
jgi:hypothetical protein